MSDGTRVKLTLPPWHIPYLEKYKIMELFHELTRELAIQQPVDHLMFIKHLLNRAYDTIGQSRIILLSSPSVNCVEVARQISLETNHQVITESAILTSLNVPNRDDVRPNALAMCLSYLLHTSEPQSNGWILVDCIKTVEEAKKVLITGVIPTHVLHLIPPFCPPLNEMLYCNVHESWPEYRRQMTGIREVFKNKVMEIHLKQRLLHEVVSECIQVVKVLKRLGCPRHLRVIIIGPRGSGRNTQAHLISQKLNLVCIEFQFLLCQAWNKEDDLGAELRAADRNVCFRCDLLVQIINRRILEEDCLERGWILTGYPFNIRDFKHLDTLDTPPNRVVFLECDLNVCKERISSRRVNVYTGSVTHLTKSNIANGNIEELKVHPKDKMDIVEAELNYYCENYGPMRNYCGETAQVVNGDQPERWVFETILAAIMKENLAPPPRNPCFQDDKVSESSHESSDTEISTSPPTQIFSCYIQKI